MADVQWRLRRHDGAYRHMQVRAVPIVDEHGAMALQHIAMLPAILAAMLLRRDEYSGHHHVAIAT